MYAILLDRDGTLNNQGGYCHPSEFIVEPWAIQAIREFNHHGLPIAIVTNQSGIADGRFSHEEFIAVSEQMLETLKQNEAFIEAMYYCPHNKEDQCKNKKPAAGMLLRACADLEIDPENSFMIGDMGYSDMQAGYRAGSKLVLVQTGHGRTSLEVSEYRTRWQYITPDYIARDVLEAAHWICSFVPKQSWEHKKTKILSL